MQMFTFTLKLKAQLGALIYLTWIYIIVSKSNKTWTPQLFQYAVI